MIRSNAIACSMMFALAACGSQDRRQAQPTGTAAPQPAQPPAGAQAEAEPPTTTTIVVIPRERQPQPASVLAMASVGQPVAMYRELSRFAQAFGAGVPEQPAEAVVADALQELVGVPLAGVDYQRPMWLLVLDPSAGPNPTVLVVGVSDQQALRKAIDQSPLEVVIHAGFAAIGTEQALRAAAPYALTGLIGDEVPAQPIVVLNIPRIRQVFEPQLQGSISMAEQVLMERARQGAMAEEEVAEMRLMIQGLREALNQTELVSFTLDPQQPMTLLATVIAEPDTLMARIFASQRPAEFSLAAQHQASPVLIAGRIAVDEMPEPARRFLSGRMSVTGARAYEQIPEAFEQWYQVTTGEMAVGASATRGAGWYAAEWQVNDVDAARTLIRQISRQTTGVPQGMRATFTANAFRHRGVQVDRLMLQPTKTMPKEQRQELERQFGTAVIHAFVAVVDDRVVTVVGRDARQRMTRLLDAHAQEAPELTAEMAPVIDQARQRGETLLVVMRPDQLPTTATGLTGPAAIGVGFQERAMTVRFTAPIERPRVTEAR